MMITNLLYLKYLTTNDTPDKFNKLFGLVFAFVLCTARAHTHRIFGKNADFKYEQQRRRRTKKDK